MKYTIMFRASLALACAFFMMAGATCIPRPESAFPEKEVDIAIRQIGHEVLLRAGDSITRVLPVQRIDRSSFKLDFQSEFTFVPKTLVNLVRKSLAAVNAPMPYVVNMVDNQSGSAVYGFRIATPKTQTTLVPCIGRVQPTGNYSMVISFLPPLPTATEPTSDFYSMLTAGLLAIAFAGAAYVKRRKPVQLTADADLPYIGKYQFDARRKLLICNADTVVLSQKETDLLKIFSGNLNQPVPRNVLMKKVWEDDGVIVSRSLDVFISRLRKKLKDDPTLHLANIHGVGYRLEDNVQREAE